MSGGGVTLCFADDYAYDWCDEAIREGYSYQIMAYTDTEYSYFNIVFTGLPILCVQTPHEIHQEDVPAHVTASAYGGEALEGNARIHIRGASTMYAEKPGYRIEFTRREDGSGKVSRWMPGFGTADDVVLLALNYDDTKMRDRLSWDLYAQMAGEEESFGARKTGYVELLVNGEYKGLYLMVEPFDVEEEIGKAASTRILTDCVYRTAVLSFSHDRLYCGHPRRGNTGFELYYSPVGEENAFDLLGAYMDLLYEEDEEAFAEKAEACMDLESVARMELLVQAGGMTDNFYNNLYIWASPEKDGVQYRFAPWDMDMTWGLKKEEVGELFENWMSFGVFDRMIHLDVGGIRTLLWDTWKALRGGVLSMEALEKRINQYAEELRDSGAMVRDAERWGTQAYEPDGYEILTFCSIRFPLLDSVLGQIAESTDAPVEFLMNPNYEAKAAPMVDLFL